MTMKECFGIGLGAFFEENVEHLNTREECHGCEDFDRCAKINSRGRDMTHALKRRPAATAFCYRRLSKVPQNTNAPNQLLFKNA